MAHAIETDDPVQQKLIEQTEHLIQAGQTYQPVLGFQVPVEERQAEKQPEYKAQHAELVRQEELHQEAWTERVVVKAPALDRAVNAITAATAAQHQRRHVQIVVAVRHAHIRLLLLQLRHHRHHHQLRHHNAAVRETVEAAVAAQEMEVHAAVDKYLI